MPMIPTRAPVKRADTLRTQSAIGKPAPIRESCEEQIDPEPARWPITPHGVYVAKRDAFELTAHPDLTGKQILALAFDLLPLREHGWDIDKTEVVHLHGNNWLVRR